MGKTAKIRAKQSDKIKRVKKNGIKVSTQIFLSKSEPPIRLSKEARGRIDKIQKNRTTWKNDHPRYS